MCDKKVINSALENLAKLRTELNQKTDKERTDIENLIYENAGNLIIYLSQLKAEKHRISEDEKDIYLIMKGYNKLWLEKKLVEIKKGEKDQDIEAVKHFRGK